MLTHAQIWTALDRLAARAGLSPSGLARKAGLDPTTFNRSKRMTPQGRSRWPSTESLAKSLAATGASMETFVQLIDEPARQSRASWRKYRRRTKTIDGRASGDEHSTASSRSLIVASP